MAAFAAGLTKTLCLSAGCKVQEQEQADLVQVLVPQKHQAHRQGLTMMTTRLSEPVGPHACRAVLGVQLRESPKEGLLVLLLNFICLSCSKRIDLLTFWFSLFGLFLVAVPKG